MSGGVPLTDIEPVWTGPRAGYSAFWLVDRYPKRTTPIYPGDYRFRMRHLDSRGKWWWSNLDERPEGYDEPCWVNEVVLKMPINEQVKVMMHYSDMLDQEVIFLGYVKDTE